MNVIHPCVCLYLYFHGLHFRHRRFKQGVSSGRSGLAQACTCRSTSIGGRRRRRIAALAVTVPEAQSMVMMVVYDRWLKVLTPRCHRDSKDN